MRLGVEAKIGAVSALFVAFIGGSAVLTTSVLRRSWRDSTTINVAGRQQMLTQKMTKEAFAVLRGDVTKDELQRTIALFDRTLAGLLKGDSDLGLQAERDKPIRAALGRVDEAWGQFRPHVDAIARDGGECGEALREVLRGSDRLTVQLDVAARTVEQSTVDASPVQISLASRQPMLGQKFTKEILSLIGTASGRVSSPRDTVLLFERTLHGLEVGDVGLGLPPSRDALVRRQLEAVRAIWEPLRIHVKKLVDLAPRLGADLEYVNENNLSLLDAMDEAVQALGAASEVRMSRLLGYQYGIFFASLVVAAVAFAYARLLVVKPVAASVETLVAWSDEILGAAQELEAVARLQSSAVDEATQTIDSLMTAATHISDSAHGVSMNAERSRETSDLTARKIKELSAHTTRMTEILDVIREIASRSDLLALNASLEGTRAGEAGRGFSLVAGEIRRLAERVGASVADVKKLVADVRDSGDSTTLATDEARKLAQDTADASQAISVITQQQRSATEQVAESIRNISGVISRSVATARQARAAAEGLNEQAKRLSAVVARRRPERYGIRR